MRRKAQLQSLAAPLVRASDDGVDASRRVLSRDCLNIATAHGGSGSRCHNTTASSRVRQSHLMPTFVSVGRSTLISDGGGPIGLSNRRPVDIFHGGLASDIVAEDIPAFVTRAALRDDLRRIGVAAGDTVMVHAAMSTVGPLLNGPDALTRALLDVLGPNGTMLVYTSWDSVHDDLLDDDGRVLPEWRDHVGGFDVAASRRCHGWVLR